MSSSCLAMASARSNGSLGKGSVLTNQGAVLQDLNMARLVTVTGAISSPRQGKILSKVQGPSRRQDGRQVTCSISLKFIQEDQQAIQASRRLDRAQAYLWHNLGKGRLPWYELKCGSWTNEQRVRVW